MTNNDTITASTFVAAAKEVADREFPDDKAGKSGNPERIAFQAGAEWARTHLAEQEVTDAEVIAALGAANRATLTGSRFDAPLSFYPDTTVKAMRAALSAARKA